MQWLFTEDVIHELAFFISIINQSWKWIENKYNIEHTKKNFYFKVDKLACIFPTFKDEKTFFFFYCHLHFCCLLCITCILRTRLLINNFLRYNLLVLSKCICIFKIRIHILKKQSSICSWHVYFGHHLWNSCIPERSICV